MQANRGSVCGDLRCMQYAVPMGRRRGDVVQRQADPPSGSRYVTSMALGILTPHVQRQLIAPKHKSTACVGNALSLYTVSVHYLCTLSLHDPALDLQMWHCAWHFGDHSIQPSGTYRLMILPSCERRTRAFSARRTNFDFNHIPIPRPSSSFRTAPTQTTPRGRPTTRSSTRTMTV